MLKLFRKKSPSAEWLHHKPLAAQDYYECSHCHREYSRTYPVCPGCSADITGTREIPNYIDDIEQLEAMFGK